MGPENDPRQKDSPTPLGTPPSAQEDYLALSAPKPRVNLALGQLVMTPGVRDAISPEEVFAALARHARGDWGSVGKEDWKENDLSLKEGFRILSAYESRDGTKFWIITESDRSSTCLLLPSEY